MEARVVLGEVLREDGQPVVSASVPAFVKGLRRDTLLGEDRTGRDGRYEIGYAPEEERFCLTVRADIGGC